MGLYIYGKLYLWCPIKNNKSTSGEIKTTKKIKLSKNDELCKKCNCKYGMHCKRLINLPRHVIDKYLIAMHLIIMIPYDALQMKREVDICLSNSNIVFYTKLGIMNTYLMEHLYTHSVVFIIQLWTIIQLFFN